MSIQLVLHPQGNSPNQIIVDGVNFFGVNNATNYSTTSSFTDIMSNAYPTIPNTWYKFINTSLGTPTVAAGTGRYRCRRTWSSGLTLRRCYSSTPRRPAPPTGYCRDSRDC